ncbi:MULTISPECIES: hypothetical protein [unclassified Bradyrhizobium]|uniref:hypothetical protein n=1 Tax=unclassified Bradyrhizobium TaxID=2631580 RepID=UPI002915E449|nr:MULTISPECIES: hypothetical protein [unclassified Bradyrhizobium]
MRFRRYGEAFDRKFKRCADEQSEIFRNYRARALSEPTKRELREQITQAVVNTAALNPGGDK